MLPPPIPNNLSRIDSATVGEHFSLDSADVCFYIWEQTARGGYRASPTNQFIKNLKIKPSEIAATPSRSFYKQQALAHGATALRKLVGQTAAENSTFVPMPSSKIAAHPEFDDRVGETLRKAFAGWKSDIQPLLHQIVSTAADHESSVRMSFNELLDVMCLGPATSSVRTRIVITDDVLNSGKHFKVAAQIISQTYPNASVIGLFLARCIRDNNASSDFHDLDAT